MTSADEITQTINRYIELIAKGSAGDIAKLYADDATVEDPVGGEVHIGRQAIQGFYANIENLKRECELVTLRVAGNEAAYHFRLKVYLGDNSMRIEPIGVMAFDDEGKVASMKAYWSPGDATN